MLNKIKYVVETGPEVMVNGNTISRIDQICLSATFPFNNNKKTFVLTLAFCFVRAQFSRQ